MESVGAPLPSPIRPRLTREEIVEAAGAIADSEGLAALNAIRLAERLRASPTTLHRHFANIEAVKDALASRAVAEMIDLHKDAVQGRAGREALLAMAHSHRTYAQARPGRYLASVYAAHTSAASVAPLKHSHLRLVARALESDDLDGNLALDLARGAMAAVQGFMVLELHGGVGTPFETDQSFQRLTEMLDAGVRAAAGSAAGRKRARQNHTSGQAPTSGRRSVVTTRLPATAEA
jgi:AcrR family transcriptional regulator